MPLLAVYYHRLRHTAGSLLAGGADLDVHGGAELAEGQDRARMQVRTISWEGFLCALSHPHSGAVWSWKICF